MFDNALPGLEELKCADDSMVVAAVTGWARVEAAASARRLAAIAELVSRRVEGGSAECGRWSCDNWDAMAARLNALFEIVVPAVVDAGGHVNKFLGDGALAVFGAPNDLAEHADAAVSAAMLIHRRVAERFGGELRIGIGINTGVVIAGTIGGGGKLEFTLIGDTVNVAARVEQLTKTTGDAILLTQQCVDALGSRPPILIDRGFHVLKGKSAAVQVFGLDQETDARVDLTS